MTNPEFVNTPAEFAELQKTRVMKRSKKRLPSPGEETMAQHLNVYKINFIREYRFHHTRQWRFDFALPDYMIAIEAEGGSWMKKGAHTSGVHFEEDCKKYAEAGILGWRIFRFTTRQIKTGYAINCIQRAIKC